MAEAGWRPRCLNCYNRLDQQVFIESEWRLRCICTDCTSQKVVRCASCHHLYFCSSECREERRRYNHHQLQCQILSGEATLYHTFGVHWITRSPLSSDHPWLSSAHDLVMEVFVRHLSNDAGPNNRLNLHQIRHISGMSCWIDEYLNYIIYLVAVLKENDVDSEELDHLMSYACNMKANYAFFSFFEKHRKVTQFRIASNALILMWPIALDVLEKYDGKIRSAGGKIEVWETLMLTLAKFFKRLRMVKYQSINLSSIKTKRPENLQALEPFVRNANRLLVNAKVKLDGKGHYDLNCGRVTLPADSRCVGCQQDLAGSKATLLLGDLQVHKVTNTPCLLEMYSITGPIISCGKAETCNERALTLYKEHIQEEWWVLTFSLTECRICHGCSMYSMKTHRCGRCRAVRYCSSECARKDWLYHKVSCKPGFREQLPSKRLAGKKFEAFATFCGKQLQLQDPMFKWSLVPVENRNNPLVNRNNVEEIQSK